jgi:hypothetical protein
MDTAEDHLRKAESKCIAQIILGGNAMDSRGKMRMNGIAEFDGYVGVRASDIVGQLKKPLCEHLAISLVGQVIEQRISQFIGNGHHE